jgi:hypothetical protein
MKLKPIKIRRTWSINPRTKIKESKKKYNRGLTKKEVRNILEKEDF